MARRHGPTLRRLRLHLLTTDACKYFVAHCQNLLHLDHGDLHSPDHTTHEGLTPADAQNNLPQRHGLVATCQMNLRDPSASSAAAVLECYAETIRAMLRACPQLMTCAGLFTQCTVRRRLINACMPNPRPARVRSAHNGGRQSMSAAYSSEGMDMAAVRTFFADQVFGRHARIGDCWNLQYFYGFTLDAIDWYRSRRSNIRMMLVN